MGYGRKGKGTPAGDDTVQDELIALRAENEQLREQLVNQQVLAGGGSVPIIDGPNDIGDDSDTPHITGGGRREPNLGKVWLCRVVSDKAPPGVKIPDVVQMAGTDLSGRPFNFRRKFFTETEIELPERIITHLELPEEREFRVETGSPVYEAALRGNLGPAHEDCQKMGFEQVKWMGDVLIYVAYIRHYTVQRIAERQERLYVPA